MAQAELIQSSSYSNNKIRLYRTQYYCNNPVQAYDDWKSSYACLNWSNVIFFILYNIDYGYKSTMIQYMDLTGITECLPKILSANTYFCLSRFYERWYSVHLLSFQGVFCMPFPNCSICTR